jgi:hypothetical protein
MRIGLKLRKRKAINDTRDRLTNQSEEAQTLEQRAARTRRPTMTQTSNSRLCTKTSKVPEKLDLKSETMIIAHAGDVLQPADLAAFCGSVQLSMVIYQNNCAWVVQSMVIRSISPQHFADLPPNVVPPVSSVV